MRRPLGALIVLRYDAAMMFRKVPVAMMRIRLKDAVLMGFVTLTLAGCGTSREVRPDEYNDPLYKGPKGSLIGNDSGSLFSLGKSADQQNQGTGIGVNAYLWRGTLDTLSFMPLVSADPFGGVIITDWYTPVGATGERFKATAYILSRELRADAVRVSLFHQVLQGGQWIDVPTSAGTTTELEDKVLVRARELRANGG
jgi:hypothetical protein